MTPETRQKLNRLLSEAQSLIAAEPVEYPPLVPAYRPMEPRRVWPDALPDCWRGGRATGEVLIERAVSEPRWFERLVAALTEELPRNNTPQGGRREQAKQDRAIAVRLLQAFFERELEGVKA